MKINLLLTNSLVRRHRLAWGWRRMIEQCDWRNENKLRYFLFMYEASLLSLRGDVTIMEVK